MRVKAKGKLKDRGPSGHFYDQLDGDEFTVHPGDEKHADRWVKRGWAKNLDTGEEHEPVRTGAKLKVNDSVSKGGK